MKRIRILKVYFVLWLFIGYVIYSNWETFVIFFTATLAFNSATLALLAIGTIFTVGAGINLVMLGGTFGALAYKKHGFDFYLRAIEQIMPAHIAHMFYSRKTKEKMLFTHEESREVIDWLENSFAKQKNYISFFTNTPLLIGLFGTFTGLLTSIDDMGKIVVTLGSGEIEIGQVIRSFSGPLSGMAVGFGSSLFAVGIAILLGIKGYILFKYQDSLIAGVEQWLKDRIVDVDIDSAQDGLPEKRESFLDVFIDQMENFTKELARIGEANKAFVSISDSLKSLNHKVNDEHAIMSKLALMLEEKTNESFGKMDTINGNVLKIADGIDTTNERSNAIITGIGKLDQNIMTLNGSVHNLENNLHSINSGVNKLDESIVGVNTNLSGVSDRVGNISQSISGIDQNISAANSILSQLQSTNTTSLQAFQDIVQSQNAVMVENLQINSQNILQINESIGYSNNLLSSLKNALTDSKVESEAFIRETAHKLENAIKDNHTSLTHIANDNRTYHKDSLHGVNKLSTLLEYLNDSIDKNKQNLNEIATLQERTISSNSESYEKFIHLLGAMGNNLIAMKKALNANDELDTQRFDDFKHYLESLKHELSEIKIYSQKTTQGIQSLSSSSDRLSRSSKETSDELVESIKDNTNIAQQTQEHIEENGKKFDEIIEGQHRLDDISRKIDKEISILSELIDTVKHTKSSTTSTEDAGKKSGGVFGKIFR